MTRPKCELQPCGHPVCAIRCENENAEQTPHWCGWCADIERTKIEAFVDGFNTAVRQRAEMDGATDA